MGRVWRAHHTALKRDDALKVLPEAFLADPERLARFQREAQILASLNHPNIAHVYGLEDADGSKALVMEFVEGPTLDDRIAHGAIPIDEALPIAQQIAEALETAHERRIIHRDLKPANIKVRPDGTVKVLDFGLAKALARQAAISPELSQSPTITTPAMTHMGIILGTAAYMAPEQAKGKTIDHRADIWAFGVVVYEMISGRRLFAAADATETIAQIITKGPDWDLLPASTPPLLRDVLRRCLVRDPRYRVQAIGDVRIALEEARRQPVAQTVPTPSVADGTAWRRMLPVGVALSGLLIASLMVLTPWRSAQDPRDVMRFTTDVGLDASLVPLFGPGVVLSPDGRKLVSSLRRTGEDNQRLYVRTLDELQPSALQGTEGARDPFFSPDGQWIGFFAAGELKKVSVNGGPAVTLSAVPDGRGGTWAEDGSIIFTPSPGAGVTLMGVSVQGGRPEPITRLDEAAGEVSHRWPQALPGRTGVLFTANTITNNYENAALVVQSLSTGAKKVIHRGGYHGRYLRSGHLVYIHEATLFAAPFDLERLELTAPPVPVLAGISATPTNGGAQFAVSDNGSLVYLSASDAAMGASIYWLDRSGTTELLRGSKNYFSIEFSPDGRRLVTSIFERQSDIWIHDWKRDATSRLTFDPAEDQYPIWTPDGRRITFASARGSKGPSNLYWQPVDGAGEPQRLTESPNQQIPMSWHPSRRFLAFREVRPGNNFDIMILPMEGDDAKGWTPGKPTPFIESRFVDREASFSPDGTWVAYQSDESGKYEVYVRPFPGLGGKWQISTDGGEYPRWSRNGKELFYRTPDQRIWVVGYEAGKDGFRADGPRLWSQATFSDRGGQARNFDLHPDGRRFAVLKTSEAQRPIDRVVLILNFFEELKRVVPTN